MVRSIGAIDGNRPAPDNDWETVVRGGEAAIEKWIADQMKYRSCTLVLIGNQTANRRWINHEIKESWNRNMGVAGIHIHGLKNSSEFVANKGGNPFDHVTFTDNGRPLSSVVKTYDPPGLDSKQRYNWIVENIAAIVEEAISIRARH